MIRVPMATAEFTIRNLAPLTITGITEVEFFSQT